MKCPECKAECNDNAKFCSECGCVLESSSQTISQTTENTPSTAPERKDMVSVIGRSAKKSGGYKALSTINMVLDIIVAILCFILFVVLFVIGGALGTIISAGSKIFVGNVNIFETIISMDLFGLLASSIAPPFFLYAIYGWLISFPLSEFVAPLVIGSYVKKQGYDRLETLDVFDHPSILNPTAANISSEMSRKEKARVFKDQNERKNNLEKAYILFPFIEKTNGRLLAIVTLILKYCSSLLTGTMIGLSFALSAPVGMYVNILLEKYIPNIKLGSLIVFLAIWALMIIIIPTLDKFIQKILDTKKKKNLAKWWEQTIEQVTGND